MEKPKKNQLKRFQFHKGTIRTIHKPLLILQQIYFNSIKVRLERVGAQKATVEIQYFNSIKVRLERELDNIEGVLT